MRLQEKMHQKNAKKQLTLQFLMIVNKPPQAMQRNSSQKNKKNYAKENHFIFKSLNKTPTLDHEWKSNHANFTSLLRVIHSLILSYVSSFYFVFSRDGIIAFGL